MRHKFYWIFVGVLVVLAGAGIGRMALLQAAPIVAAVSLSANPTTFSGNCPTQVLLTIKLQVKGPCRVQYDIVTDTGLSFGKGALNCQAAGTFTGTEAITITKGFAGWVAVQITAPVVAQSNRVTLQINCQKVNISAVHWLYCNVHNSQLMIDVLGIFNNSKGNKEIKIGNLTGWTLGAWTQTCVEASGPFNIVPWTQTYPIIIVDGNLTVSTTFQCRFPYHIEYEAGFPNEVPAGSILNISVYGLPSTQGGLEFRLHNLAGISYPFPVVSWAPPYVRLRVPNISGFYGYLDIYDGSIIASDTVGGFKVI